MICPQGPLETPIGPGATGYAWYPMSMGGPPDVGAILSSRQKLHGFLDACMKRYPIDARKLAVLGFSQGGVMAYSLALESPERFAGLAVLSSWLPKELLPKLSINEEAIQSLPSLVQHGTQDSMIEVGRARDSVERLRELRVPSTYREYDMAHEITPRSLSDLSAWLEEKVLSPIVIAG
jgi:phospholipase/carboxylesterase